MSLNPFPRSAPQRHPDNPSLLTMMPELSLVTYGRIHLEIAIPQLNLALTQFKCFQDNTKERTSCEL